MRKAKMEKKYQSWFWKDKKVNKKLYEAALKDRKSWRNKRIAKIKKIIIDNQFGIKKKENEKWHNHFLFFRKYG